MPLLSQHYSSYPTLAQTFCVGVVLSFASPALADCPTKSDRNGVWSGDVSVGGSYTLNCSPGFKASLNATVVCPETEQWPSDPVCVNIDDCATLKHGCGAQGLCIDRVNGYTCDCEEGVEKRQAEDDSGEWVCGHINGQKCNGHTCGAYGICVDLDVADADFDSGKGAFRCSCMDGYYDDGTKCAPHDCGSFADERGIWSGDSAYGALYTLTCEPGAYVFGGSLQVLTIVCPRSGKWASQPMCVNPRLEALDAEFRTFRWYFNAGMACVCVICAALAAGLTMGLVSIEPFDMRLLLGTKIYYCDGDNEQQHLKKEQALAARILPIVSDHHMLLVTLLLLNSLANEALPIFLDQLVPSWAAVLLSVGFVLVFGEILPSAVFTGPSQLKIAAFFAPFVRCLQCLFFPVAKPIACLLDRFLSGEDHGGSRKYSRPELRTVLDLHVDGPELMLLHRCFDLSKMGVYSAMQAPLVFSCKDTVSEAYAQWHDKNKWAVVLKDVNVGPTWPNLLGLLHIENAQKGAKRKTSQLLQEEPLQMPILKVSLITPVLEVLQSIQDLPSTNPQVALCMDGELISGLTTKEDIAGLLVKPGKGSFYDDLSTGTLSDGKGAPASSAESQGSQAPLLEGSNAGRGYGKAGSSSGSSKMGRTSGSRDFSQMEKEMLQMQ